MSIRFNLFGNELATKFGKRFANAAMLIQQSPLPKATQELVSLRASQINGCGFCVDYHTKDATVAGETAVRLHLVAAWRESTVFTEAERAALALAEEGTRLADAHQGVSDETWAQVRKHYDDDQVGVLVCLVSLINAANRMNVIVPSETGWVRVNTAVGNLSVSKIPSRTCSSRSASLVTSLARLTDTVPSVSWPPLTAAEPVTALLRPTVVAV